MEIWKAIDVTGDMSKSDDLAIVQRYVGMWYDNVEIDRKITSQVEPLCTMICSLRYDKRTH